jgi:hypothetical protein
MGKNRSISRQILYRLKVIEDKLDGMSHNMIEENALEMGDRNGSTSTAEDKDNAPASNASATETNNPNYADNNQTNQRHPGFFMTPNRAYPNYPFMSGRPNPYYPTAMQAQTRHFSPEGGGQEQKPTLDIGTLIRLMNDPLVKQVIGFFKNRNSK